MKKLSLLVLVTLLVVAFNGLNFGQTISYPTTAAVITQNFDGLPSTGTFTFTGNGPFQLSAAPPSGVGATGMAGWYGVNNLGSGANMIFAVENGSGNSGGVKSLGTTAATDRALGTLASATNVNAIGALITNNTGGTLNKFTIIFTGEQWRVANTITNTMSFSYKIGATTINDVAGYINEGSLNFVSPIFNTTTGTALDGNASVNRIVGITATIAGLTWPAGSVLGIRWQDANDAGSDQALAIDDWSFSADVQTITNYYYKGTGLLNSTANWGTATNGTGSAPANFTADGQIFNVRNTSAVSTSGAFTISGVGSKIVIGDGTNACALTVVSGSPLTSTTDVSANATLNLQDAAIPDFNNLNIASTVNFAQSSTLEVPVGATFGNLKLTGGTKTFAAGTTSVDGSLVVDAVTNLNGPVASFSTVAVRGNVTFQNSTTFATDHLFTLDCNGTSQQTIFGNGIPISLFRISVDNAAGVVLSTTGGATNVTLGSESGGGATTGLGQLITGSNTVTLATTANSTPGPILLSEAGTHYVNGNLTITRTTVGVLQAAMGNTLWGTGIIGGENWGDITVTRVTGTGGIVTVGAFSGIKCTWTISSSVAPVLGRQIQFGWVSDLTNGKDLTTMQAYRSTNGGTSWATIGAQYNATTSTADSIASVTALGKFTVSDAADPLVVTTPSITITAQIEGFSNGTTMIPDNVTAELHASASPHALVTSVVGALNSSGTHTFNFPAGSAGTAYFIAIKHRNAVETWSAAATSASTYDFTSAQGQAFGSNMIHKGTVWCFYSGDVNHDGIVDSGDLGLVDNDNANYVSGYTDTDVNGDGIVDSGDLGIVDNNNVNYVGAVIPSVPPVKRAIHHVTILQDVK